MKYWLTLNRINRHVIYKRDDCDRLYFALLGDSRWSVSGLYEVQAAACIVVRSYVRLLKAPL